jgi:GTPase Era involved in 16S rRNA processing
MIRLYAFGKSVECSKYCSIGLRHGAFAERPVVASALDLADRFRASPSPRVAFHGPFTGSLRFSSEGGKQFGTVECSKSGSAGGSDASFERRRQKYLEKLACPGCGVYMQDKDPSRPGYFKMPAILEKAGEDLEGGDEDELEGLEDEELGGRAELDDSDFVLDEEDEEEDEEDMDMDSRVSIATEWNDVGDDRQAGKDAWAEILGGKYRPTRDRESADEEEEEKVVVCARCHALRNYGKVKDESLENLLPDFDFERVVGARLKKAYGRRAVVLMVVDGSDFDGSFPRKAAEALAEAEDELGTAWQEGRAGNTPRLLVVMNKIDLLPKQISANRLEQWVRRRSRSGGVTRVAGVHLVSAFKGWGVEQLAEHIKQLAGPRGDCWVVGAQNAGKSSLINSLAKFAGEKRKKTALTEAAVPGTTLGVLKLEGILPGRARLFDTPGLIHPHQLSTKLNREELKLVEVRKELKPRTFRVKVRN